MKKIVKYCFCILFAIFFSNCKKDEVEIENIEFELKAIASPKMDEEKWGNFNLVLELEKSTFSKGESCITQLSFANIGEKDITLDGILPYRQSANEPFIYLSSESGENYQIFKLLEEVFNEDKIIIKVNNSVKLMQFDLNDVEGIRNVKNNDGFIDSEDIKLEDELKTGKYYISASFYPTPQVYTCTTTDTLTFEIK